MPRLSELDLPQSGFETNTGLEAALRSGSYRLRVVNRLEKIISGLTNGDWDYLPDYIVSNVPINLKGKKFGEDDFTEGRIHTVWCSNNGKLTLDLNDPLTGVVLVTNCEIKFSQGAVLEDVVIATTHTGARSINSPSSLQVGRDDDCAVGGGAQLLTMGGMNFPADLMLYGGQLIAKGDIEFAANADGIEGASIIAGGEISGTSNMDMGFCGTGMEDNFEAMYFRLAM